MISSFWKKPMEALDEFVLNLRVLPNDVDITKITNDRFLALMDLGRMDIAFRTGLLKSMYKNKWVPLATFDTIRFRYPLKMFQKYQLRTRVVWWDDTTMYFKQVFERKGRVVASGYVCATFLGSNGTIPPDEIMAEIGQSITKPNEPEIVAKLREIESLIHETQKE
jgi:acyl-CoA thioesterase FadM